MTIGSAVDSYMANLAKLSVKIKQDAEKKTYQLEKPLPTQIDASMPPPELIKAIELLSELLNFE
ncbi:MAG: hypothetical protein RJA83_357 [Pseudomonadota bacterium]